MAGSVKKGKGSKQPPAKKPSAKSSAASKAPKAKKTSKKALPLKQRTAAPLVLIIMVLVTVIIFLLLKPAQKNDYAADIRPVKGKQAMTEMKDVPADKKQVEIKEQNEIAGKAEEAKKAVVSEKKSFNVHVWLLRFDEKAEKVSLVSVKRTAGGDDRLEGALRKLLEGPTKEEGRHDYLTALPKNLKLLGVTVNNRIAEIDFSESLGENANGTIIMNRLDQIVYTATQFDDIDGVIIAINGKKQTMLGSDGLSVQGPLRRR